jgi:hypothetical protein
VMVLLRSPSLRDIGTGNAIDHRRQIFFVGRLPRSASSVYAKVCRTENLTSTSMFMMS